MPTVAGIPESSHKDKTILPGDQTLWSISSHVRSLLDGESGILLDLRNGRFCGLNKTGVRIWAILQQSRIAPTEDAILNSLQEEFNVPVHSLKADMNSFLHKMLNQGLLQNNKQAGHMDAAAQYCSSLSSSLDKRFFEDPGERSKIFHFIGAIMAFAGLVTAKFLLKIRGFRSLHSIVRKWRVRNRTVAITIKDISAMVEKGARFCPRHAWCLERAAVTVCILRLCGLPAQFVIGCRKMPFGSHAWAEISSHPINESIDVRKTYQIIESC